MRSLARIVLAVGLAVSGPALADKPADASYKEGLAYKQQGKTDEAIKALEEAVATNPKHGLAWASLMPRNSTMMSSRRNDTDRAVWAFSP